MDDPHYYSYTYEVADSAFTARAEGDLDCDGVTSTFEMVGSMTSAGELVGELGLYRNNEME